MNGWPTCVKGNQQSLDQCEVLGPEDMWSDYFYDVVTKRNRANREITFVAPRYEKVEGCDLPQKRE